VPLVRPNAQGAIYFFPDVPPDITVTVRAILTIHEAHRSSHRVLFAIILVAGSFSAILINIVLVASYVIHTAGKKKNCIQSVQMHQTVEMCWTQPY